MSPARYPLRHSATTKQNQTNFIKRKKLPRPGIEPESLRPQRNILTVRPPKHLFFLLFSLVELLGLVTPGTERTHRVACLATTLVRHEATGLSSTHSEHGDISTSIHDPNLEIYDRTLRSPCHSVQHWSYCLQSHPSQSYMSYMSQSHNKHVY